MAGKPPLSVVVNRSDGSREELDVSGITGVVWTPRFKALPGVQQVRGGVLQLRLEYDQEPGREWLRFDATRTRDPFHGVVWGELAGTVAGMLGTAEGADPDHRYAPCASRWPVDGEAPATDGSFLVGEMIWAPSAAKREAPAKPRAQKAPRPAPAEPAPAPDAPARKAPGRKAAATSAVTKAAAKKAPAKKAPAKKAPAKKVSAKKAPARKASARKAAAKKAPAKGKR